MNKRFTHSEIVPRVDLAREPDFSVGRIRVQPARREVVGENWKCTLEPRVMQVLVALARAKGAVVSRDELIEACWDGVVVGEDAVNRSIGRLRKAAEASGGALSVETLPRVGYRLVSKNWSASEFAEHRQHCSICVLPFTNMSGEVEQEYFSDGISEDIITDLSKISALVVVSRNSSFAFKNRNIDLPNVARQLNVTHVLEGSVRKEGAQVRVTAHLVDGVTNEHVWAERYDRDLNDIFALQAQISGAIAKALKLRLLPEEKKAIERRGTTNIDAYNLYLMARQHSFFGSSADVRREEALIRLCKRAVEIDPDYAAAWALMAFGQLRVQFLYGSEGDGGLAAVEQALMLDPNLAEAHAVKAGIFGEHGEHDAANAEIAVALNLDPRSWEVNRLAAQVCFKQRRFEDAAQYFEMATALSEMDLIAPLMAITCYEVLRDTEAMRDAARTALARAERVLAQDRSNGNAISCAVNALAVLGEAERARKWIEQAILVDPGNMIMRYNLACALSGRFKDVDASLDLLGPFFETTGKGFVDYAKVDPDLDCLRAHSRFRAMMAAAEARLALGQSQAMVGQE